MFSMVFSSFIIIIIKAIDKDVKKIAVHVRGAELIEACDRVVS